MSLKMKNGLYTRNAGKTWGYVLDLGEQDAQRCDGCRKNHWAEGGRIRTCPKCGGELRSVTVRRQSWHPASFATKTEARRARDQAQGKVAGGSFVVPTRETLGSFLSDWLESIRPSLAATTFRSYSDHVSRHIAPALGHVPIGKLSPRMIRKFYADLATRPRAGKSGTLGMSTVQRIHATLHRALESAVRDQVLTSNPAHKEKPKAPKKARRPEIKVWSPTQLSTFLEGVRSDDLYALWRVLAWTGLRRGEVCGLQWSDIDFEGKRLTVTRSIVLVSYEPHVTTPKSGESRTVDLDTATINLLRAHRVREIEVRLALGLPQIGDADYVFTQIDPKTKGAQFVHPDRVSKRFDALVAKSDLPRVRLHDLRHTHASHLLAAGANVKVVQERLGHASITITLDTYSHLMPTAQSEAVDALSKLYGAAG